MKFTIVTWLVSINSGMFSFEPSDWLIWSSSSHWFILFLLSRWLKMKDNKSFILTAKNKKNKPLKKWPIKTTAGFYADRVTDASCVIDKKHLATYEGGFSQALEQRRRDLDARNILKTRLSFAYALRWAYTECYRMYFRVMWRQSIRIGSWNRWRRRNLFLPRWRSKLSCRWFFASLVWNRRNEL